MIVQANFLFRSKQMWDQFYKDNLGFEPLILKGYKPFHVYSELLAKFLISQNHNSHTIAVVSKIKAVAALILWAPLALVSFVLAGFVDLIKNQKPFSVFHGLKESQERNELSILSFNTCMLWGAMPLIFGGMTPYYQRINQLFEFLKTYEPDVICLQELSRPAGLDLWQKIKHDYNCCLYNIAPKPFVMLDAQLFIASKQTILDVKVIKLPTNGAINRALVAIELGSQWILTTHLEAGSEFIDKQMRKVQSQLILKEIEKIQKESSKPLILMGDLNISRQFQSDDEYSENVLFKFLDNLDCSSEISRTTATFTNEFTTKMLKKASLNSVDELIDYALCSDKSLKSLLTKIDTYTSCVSPLSDHKALFLKMDGTN